MTTLLLLRHGQASFDGPAYDRLCPQGEKQARLLGAGLRREGRLPDAAISGELDRQKKTAVLALEAAEHDLEVGCDAAFDEYPSEALFQSYLPAIQAADPELAAAGPGYRANRRLFQKALSAVLERWQAGAPCAAESWEAFRGRVTDGLDRAVSGRGKDDVVAVFTSGGVIGTAVGLALGLPPATAIGLSWRLHNASLTEVFYGRRGFSLISFNGTAHLRQAGDERLLTFR